MGERALMYMYFKMLLRWPTIRGDFPAEANTCSSGFHDCTCSWRSASQAKLHSHNTHTRYKKNPIELKSTTCRLPQAPYFNSFGILSEYYCIRLNHHCESGMQLASLLSLYSIKPWPLWTVPARKKKDRTVNRSAIQFVSVFKTWQCFVESCKVATGYWSVTGSPLNWVCQILKYHIHADSATVECQTSGGISGADASG